MNIKYFQRITLLLLLVAGIQVSLSHGADKPVIFGQSELSIMSSSTRYKFNIEVADNDAQRARGLMYRREMPDQSGMLFLFDDNRMVAMWMKNTFLPLDIIFIDQTGAIVHIAKTTVPHSLDIISSQSPVVSAFEVNAGVTDRLGIKVGDRVEHSFFTAHAR